MKKYLLFALAAMLSVFTIAPASAQVNIPTKKLPYCWEYRPVPCTGVVPVDSETGEPLSWAALLQGGGNGGNITPVTKIDRGVLIGATAVVAIPANTNRVGYNIQVQSNTASCYVNELTTATADYKSLLISPLGYLEVDKNVSLGQISVICTQINTPVYIRELVK